MRFPALAIVCCIFLPFHAAAQDMHGRIVVTGVGHASAPPDKATVRIEVSQTARQTSVAMQNLTEATETVLVAVRAYGVSEDDIETTQFRLTEDWSYENDTRRFNGYEAATSLVVEVRELTGIGNLITAVSKGGGVEIRGPIFGLQDERALYDEAKRNAVLDGLATARLLADAAGVTLGMPLLITDGTETSGESTGRWVVVEEPILQEEPMDREPIGVAVENGVPVIPAAIEAVEEARLEFLIQP